MTTNILFI